MTKNSRGFTLIEVAVAVAILGIALTTLIGLQTRLLDSYQHERSRERAALYAQYLMSIIEVQKEAPDLGYQSSDCERMLRKAGYFDVDSAESEIEQDSLDGWTCIQNVDEFEVPVPGLEELPVDVLRQIRLTISWSEAAKDSYTLMYLMTPINK